MFTKAEPPKKAPTMTRTEKPLPQSQVPSLMAENMQIKGDIVNNGALQIDGQVDGKVCSKNLVVGVKGVITGDIVAEEITIFGKVIGNIIANTVVLESHSSIEANIQYERIQICDGSNLNGKLVQTAFDAYSAFEGEKVNVGAPDSDKLKSTGNIGNMTFDTEKKSKNG